MNAWNKYVAALWSVKWADAKSLPALLCLLLIVEVTPHLWAFTPPNLDSLENQIYRSTGTLVFTSKKYFSSWFILMTCFIASSLGLKQNQNAISIQVMEWDNDEHINKVAGSFTELMAVSRGCN